MDDFKTLLNKQIKKVTEETAAVPKPAPGAAKNQPRLVETVEAPPPAKIMEEARPTVPTRSKARPAEVEKGAQGRNTNRVTVNLFEADSRALAVIRELLGSSGHDFTSRSDSMKIGLRLAAKARPEDLAKLYEQVKAEDRRFRGNG